MNDSTALVKSGMNIYKYSSILFNMLSIVESYIYKYLCRFMNYSTKLNLVKSTLN